MSSTISVRMHFLQRPQFMICPGSAVSPDCARHTRRERSASGAPAMYSMRSERVAPAPKCSTCSRSLPK